MKFLSAILDFIDPKTPTDLGVLAAGTCVLPELRKIHKAPKQDKAPDAYVENQATNTWGFHTATAINQNDGAVPELTGYDVTLLKERGYWGKGKTVAARNASCKRMWHNGETERATATSLGVSESWVEKRFGTFATALSQELAENGAI